jgi:ankyrin repeat protein
MYDVQGMAAIHLSAIHGRLECLKYFIEDMGIDVNLPSKNGWRAIHLVISNSTGKRAFDCLQYLLHKGANHSM